MKKQFNYKLLLHFNRRKAIAFQTIFSHYYKPITYFVFKIVNDVQAAEDIIQDAFTKVYLQKKRKFTSLAEIGRYLHVVARNAAFDYLEKKRKDRQLFIDNSRLDMDRVGGGINLYEQNELEKIEIEVLEIICEAIDGLPPNCKMVWQKLFFEDMGVDDVANEMDVTPETVRSQKRRGLILIKEKLKEKAAGKGLLFWLIILNFLYEVSLK